MIILLSFLENQWVVGIGAGIISGLIVFFVTKWILQRKDNSKYLELISVANFEIIRILKPYIAEKGLPEKEILDAIILSTARKYKVKSEELYSIRIICEELIREIVENVYVSSDKKHDYSTQLKDYLLALDTQKDKSLLYEDFVTERKNIEIAEKINYKSRLEKIISAVTAVFATMMTFIIYFLSTVDSLHTPIPLLLEDNRLILIITIVSLVFLITVLISTFFRNDFSFFKNDFRIVRLKRTQKN